MRNKTLVGPVFDPLKPLCRLFHVKILWILLCGRGCKFSKSLYIVMGFKCFNPQRTKKKININCKVLGMYTTETVGIISGGRCVHGNCCKQKIENNKK